MTVRPSPLLDAATRSRPAVNPAPPGTATAVLVGEGSTPSSVRVRLYGTELDLPAAPGKWVVNGLVWVEMAEGGRPVRVTGPAMEPREGQQVIDHMPTLLPFGPAELSDEDRRRFADAEQAISDARAELATLDADLAELDVQLAATARALPVFGRYQPEAPHPEGTIWYQQNSSGHIVGVWEQAGPGDGTNWQGRPLTSTAVVSLTAAQITAGTGAFQTAVAQKIWAEVITAARVSANRGVFRDLVAEHVNVVSSSGGRGVRITDQGIILVGADGSAAVDLTTAATTYLSILSGGRRVAGLEADGTVSGRQGEFTRDVVVAGQSIVGALAGAGGRSLGKTQLQSRVPVGPYTTKGILERAFTVPRSGHRQVLIRGRVELGGAPSSWAVAGLHFSTNAYTTTGNTRRHAEAVDIHPDRAGGGRIEFEVNTAELGVQPGATVRVLLSLQTDAQGVYVEPGTGTYLSFMDLGPAVATARTVLEPAAPITRAPERTTSRDWVRVQASNFQSYTASGAPISKSGSDVGASYAVQGDSGVGMKWSLIEFDYPQLAAAVQGATVLAVRAGFNAAHWYPNAGGTAVVGVYGPIPASLPSSQIGAWGLKSVHVPRGGWGEVQFDANVNAGVQSLQTRSISFFTTNHNTSFYGYMHPMTAYLNILREK